MEKLLVTVLRSGGEYNGSHVRWLKDQLPEDIDFLCLSDVEIEGVKTIPFRYDWPSWWAKIELFNPQNEIGDKGFLYMDLDTIVVGDITPFFDRKTFTALSDVSKCGKNIPICSALMYIPVDVKEKVWSTWMASSKEYMTALDSAGESMWNDQEFIDSVLVAERWQDVLPGSIVSYKIHVRKAKKSIVRTFRNKIRSLIRSIKGKSYDSVVPCGNGTITEGAKIICFHGKPRPWHIDEEWVNKLE